MGFQTDCTATGEDRSRFHGSIAPPVYESSLFVFPSYGEFRQAYGAPQASADEDIWLYSRVGNPTVRALERKLALLEGGEDARAFASGMAAISAAVLSVTRSGDHIVAARSVYSTAYKLLADYLPRLGIDVTFVDFADLEAVESAIQPTTRLLYLESPGNPGMHLIDLTAAAQLARRLGLVSLIDSTLATPYNMRPLEMGIDLVAHSATKYLSGHADVIAGALIGSADRLRGIAEHEVHHLGGMLAPFEAWLVLRGLRTLGLRMKAHNESAFRIAGFLEMHPCVERVLYPGLPSHPQHALAVRQMRGFSGMVSMIVRGGASAAERFVDSLRYFGIGVSWGGFESLALPIRPDVTAFASEIGVVPGFVRLSIGLEDTDDLIADLDRALKGVACD